ncbi:MAG: SDR family oxidoreductase [Chloroflexota bacterium]|jgi:NAD(P)-dependent dehydrogenase (short-subunit alcohol dehydrogenase family)
MTSARIALVSGGGSGIGRASAVALARDGFTVVVTGRQAAPLDATTELCRATSADSIAVPADVTDPASVETLFATVTERFGRLDLLFNNAGRSAPEASVGDLPIETWREVVDVNLTSVFLMTRQAFRLMASQEPRGGRIINNGSIAAHAPRPLAVAYTATKHAITGLTKSTSLDGRPYDIACGQIDIGNAATDMAGPQAAGILQPDGRIAVEPTMDVEDVGRSVAFMASLPLDSNVQFMTVMATKMPYIGRG